MDVMAAAHSFGILVLFSLYTPMIPSVIWWKQQYDKSK